MTYRTDVWWWSEAKGEVLNEAGETVARVVSDSAADPQDGDGPIMAAARDLLKVLEETLDVLDRIPNHHTMSVNQFIDESGFTARATDAIIKARGHRQI
jgi:hypothetical protein